MKLTVGVAVHTGGKKKMDLDKNLETIADVILQIDSYQRHNKVILQCINCKTVNLGGVWTGVTPLPVQTNYDRFSHGYCPPCSEIAIADMMDYYDNIENNS